MDGMWMAGTRANQILTTKLGNGLYPGTRKREMNAGEASNKYLTTMSKRQH